MKLLDRDIAQNAKSWPFEEAKKIISRLKKLERQGIQKKEVIFETGYGPSGLPHIGTFQEVARTAMVRYAFSCLSDLPSKIISVSDDMDGLRKVPGNIPNQEMLKQYIGIPLTSIPDPFEKFESFAHHNNAKLQEFLDSFGFDYEFISSTEEYRNGKNNEGLLKMLEKHDEIVEVVNTILGDERASTYSPFLPLSPSSGKVLQVPILNTNLDKGTVTFEDEDGEIKEVPVTDGHCKAQWRPDWALHWYSNNTDYEMAGEDLKSSRDMALKILRILGKEPPEGFHYKLFLDEQNQKISKSKGNGISIEEWLRYAPQESLSYYIYGRPSSGKKLYFDVIPKAVDEYIKWADKFRTASDEEKVANACLYIHQGEEPPKCSVSFDLLLNLVAAANTNDRDVIWGFIQKYSVKSTPESEPFLNTLIDKALNYYKDFVLPTKQYRQATEQEKKALLSLSAKLEALPENASAEDIQTEVFSAAKENGYEKPSMRDWFQAIYEVVLGQPKGPRFGSFIALYGKDDTISLIEKALNGAFLNQKAA